jgi:hypothetical protein
MADKKISALTGATTPLAGTEVLPIVQSGSTVKVAVSNLTAGRTVNGSGFIASGSFGAGGTTPTAGWNTAVFQTQNAAFNSNNGQDLRLYQNIYYDGSNYRYITANPGGFMLQYQNETEWFRSTDGSPAAGGVANVTSVVKFTTTGNFNVSNGNLVIGTAGKGIDFSAATHAAGMTSELLNDYEEGTWTPTISRAGGGLTYTPSGSDVGYYTKIGRQVIVTCSFGGTWTGGSGDYEILGLPFTVGGSLYTRVSTAIINNSAANTLGQCWPVTGGTKLTSFDTFVSGNICSAGAIYFV